MDRAHRAQRCVIFSLLLSVGDVWVVDMVISVKKGTALSVFHLDPEDLSTRVQT